MLSFTSDDQVIVYEDELINLQVTVFGIDENSVRILAKHFLLYKSILKNKVLCRLYEHSLYIFQ